MRDGKKVGVAKNFTDEQIRKTRKLRSEGMTLAVLSIRFETCPTTICAICLFKRYKEVK